jgi:anti-sigma regulatory factor (Ser/Thr protein kinase)
VEITAGWTHQPFPIGDASRVGEARRYAAQVSSGLGWTDVEAGRLALIVTELATNLLRHARNGRLLIAVRTAAAEVEVVAIDEGPGIPDVDRSLRDGYSTGGGSPGTGLGAIRRLASDFDLHSSPRGTVCVARVRSHVAGAPGAGGIVRFGAICIPAPGEAVCGDAWVVACDGARVSMVVADGLGHGPQAAEASLAAAAVLRDAPFDPLRTLLERMHTALQTTRGAAVLGLQLDAAGASIRYAGAGNVLGRAISGIADRSLATQHGTVGLQMRKVDETELALPQHALVVVHSDGIASRWDPQALVPVLEHDPTIAAAILLRDHSRGRDDATIVVLQRKE